MRTTLLTLITATALALLAGCGVSKQVVAEKDAALEGCNASLSTCQESLQGAQGEAAGLRSQLDAARAEARTLGVDLENLREDAQRKDQELGQARASLEETRRNLGIVQEKATALEATENELRLKLDKQMRECTVDIERLRGQLRVRMLDSLFFQPGSADILPEGRAVLDQVASTLEGTDGKIRVEGHTDDVPIGRNLKGRWPSNWELSAARGAAVVRYFQYAHQMDPRRMSVVGHASFQPLAPNDSAENRRRNRRVEIVLTQAP